METWFLKRNDMENIKLADLSIKEFLAKTASGSPVPGGGSVAALSACLAASLAEMVANVTIGKKGYETAHEQMKNVAQNATDCRDDLIKDIDKDSAAYNEVLSAFRLPKESEQEKKDRNRAIQDAFKNASLVPLGVAKKALRIIELAEKVLRHGNKNAATDGAVAVMLARTAVLAASYNVKINLPSIRDVDFVEEIKKDVEKLDSVIEKKEREILSLVSI
jgi:formiminotetrahydrofolate cyclodeaminase